MAQAIARKIQRSIAGIMTRAESVCGTIHDRFFAPNVQQRSDDWDFGVEHVDDRSMTHPLETRESSAAQEMHQHGFHLVVSCMTDGDRLRTETTGLLHEETVT